MHPSEVYARQLLAKAQSYPLWLPEPSDDLPVEYRKIGVGIGDVGVLTPDGAFDFIFNICVPASDLINSLGVPRGFEEIQLGEGDIRKSTQYIPGSDVASTNTEKRSVGMGVSLQGIAPIPAGAGVGFEITTSSKAGAVLLLPDGASSCNLRRCDRFRDYAVKHAPSWYEFVNVELERGVESGSLYLITGADKAASWGAACFSDLSGEDTISLKFTAAQVAAGSVYRAWKWETYNPVSRRCYPWRIESEAYQNQAVFIRGFKVAIRDRLASFRGKVKVSAIEGSNPRDIFKKSGFIPYTDRRRVESLESSRKETPGQGPDDGVMLNSFPEVIEPYHPSTVIGNYLLESKPEAQVALVHDDDWSAVITLHDVTVPDDMELLQRICSRYRVESDSGGAYLIKNDPLTFKTDTTKLRNSELPSTTEGVIQEYPSITPRLPPRSREEVASARDLSNKVTMIGTSYVAIGGLAAIYLGDYDDGSGNLVRVAIKVFRGIYTNPDGLEAATKRLNRESKVWAKIEDHPNVQPFLGICATIQTIKFPALVSPWREYGDVRTFLWKHPNENRLAIVKGIANGLLHLHSSSEQVVHGDLTPNNVLIDDNRSPRICGFSNSIIVGSSGFTTDTVGTFRFIAPELMGADDEPAENDVITCTDTPDAKHTGTNLNAGVPALTPEADVYSFGMVALEVLTGQLPFYHITNHIQLATMIGVSGRKPERREYNSPELSDHLWSLLERCWGRDPHSRPKIQEVVDDLNNIN